jgi:ribosomal 30S subunit maturation factor RimM
VLFLLKKNVYVSKDSLSFNDGEILDEDLITYKVLTNTGKIGIIKEIFKASETNKIIRVLFDKEVLIPYNFIKKIDKDKKEITVELIDGMN